MDVFMYWTSISLLFYWNGWSGVARWSRWVPWGPAGSGGGCHGDKGSSATQSAVAPASSPRPPILPFLLKQHIHLAPSQSNQLSNENPMRIQWESNGNDEADLKFGAKQNRNENGCNDRNGQRRGSENREICIRQSSYGAISERFSKTK